MDEAKALSVVAALANGMLAHADETDDSHAPSRTHPGCAVVPAALAIAERAQASGERFMRAIVLGYDICARVNEALGAEGFAAAGRSTHSVTFLSAPKPRVHRFAGSASASGALKPCAGAFG